MSKENKEEDILALGKKEIEIEERATKNKTIPLAIVLVIIGLTLMIIGVFYNEITGLFISKYKSKTTKTTEEIQKEKKELLECSREDKDEDLGVTTITSYSFYFGDNKLNTSDQKIVVKSMDDSDIGTDNIKVLKNKYSEFAKKYEEVNGIQVNLNASKDKLITNIYIDYNSIEDLPTDEILTIVGSKDDDYKTIKQKMVTEVHTLCD